MNNFIKYFFVLTLLLLTTASQDSRNFEFDFAQFKVDSTSNLVEIYYSFNLMNFKQRSIDSEKDVAYKLEFKFYSATDSNLVLYDSLSGTHNASDLTDGNNKNIIIGLQRMIVPIGEYLISLSLLDRFDSSFGYTDFENLVVKKFSPLKPEVSDIQLANSIKAENENSTFAKNTLSVVPNPSAAYSSDKPLMQYYSELYNVSSKSLILSTYLLNNNLKVVYSKEKIINSDNDSIVEVGQINLLRYSSGIYTLQLILSDSTNNYAYASQKKFYFYNKLYADTSNRITDKSERQFSRFSLYSEEECDRLYEMSKYIATDAEKNQYEKLTSVKSKQRFLDEFWRKRNSSLDSEKPSYDEYINRVNEANKKFKQLGREGFKSERGRVFITYGEPDRIEKFPNEPNLKPYEVWYYDSIEGGVRFVFGDLTGFSDYELLHSDKRGEVYDDSWRRRLLIN